MDLNTYEVYRSFPLASIRRRKFCTDPTTILLPLGRHFSILNLFFFNCKRFLRSVRR